MARTHPAAVYRKERHLATTMYLTIASIPNPRLPIQSIEYLIVVRPNPKVWIGLVVRDAAFSGCASL